MGHTKYKYDFQDVESRHRRQAMAGDVWIHQLEDMTSPNQGCREESRMNIMDDTNQPLGTRYRCWRHPVSWRCTRSKYFPVWSPALCNIRCGLMITGLPLGEESM